MEPRKYAMMKMSRGDYLLPSNDGCWLWRIYTYEEDGNAEWRTGKPIVGTYWACARRRMPTEWQLEHIDLESWEDWELWAGPLDTRAEAIKEAMRV